MARAIETASVSAGAEVLGSEEAHDPAHSGADAGRQHVGDRDPEVDHRAEDDEGPGVAHQAE